MGKQDVEGSETTRVSRRLDEILHCQRQNAALDEPMNYERPFVFFRGQDGGAWNQRCHLMTTLGKPLRHLGRHSSNPVPLGIPGAARDENAHRDSGLVDRARAARVRGAVPPVLPSCSRMRAACAAAALRLPLRAAASWTCVYEGRRVVDENHFGLHP